MNPLAIASLGFLIPEGAGAGPGETVVVFGLNGIITEAQSARLVTEATSERVILTAERAGSIVTETRSVVIGEGP